MNFEQFPKTENLPEESPVAALERRNKRLFDFISEEEVFPSEQAFVVRAGKIETDEGVYLDSPRTREMACIAYEIKKRLPPQKAGTTRLWRGNRPAEVGKNPSYTNSLVGIALPFLLAYGGELSYVDVPDADIDKYDTHPSSLYMKSTEFSLEESVLQNVRVVGYGDEESEQIIHQSLSLEEVGRENVNPWSTANL